MPANDWSSSEPKNYVLLLAGGIKSPMKGIQSQTQVDVVWYDNEVYRDEIDAPFMGTGRTLNVNQGGGGFVISNGEQAVEPGIISGAITYASPSDPHLEQSDSFLHVAPRFTEKTRSAYLWWSGASGTGDVIGTCWADEFVALSPDTFTRLT
jgi:hypothetical protein